MIRSKFMLLIIGYSCLFNVNAQKWSIVYQNLSSNQRFECIDAASKDTILFSGAFASTGINFTRGEGTWYTVPTSYGFYKTSFLPNTKIGYGAAGVDKGLMKTIDGGKTWSLLSRPSITAMSCVFAVNANNIFFGGSGELWRSTDGTTFTVAPVSSQFEALVDDIFFINQTTGYMITADFDIRKTTNGGNTWTVVSSIVGISKKIFFTSENIGYIAGSGGIYKTTDGAQNWTKIYTSKSSEFFQSIHWFDANNAVAVGIGGSIIYTHDTGNTWYHSNSGTSVDLYGVYMLSATSALVCGDKFTLLKSDNIDLETVATDVLQNQAAEDVFMIYPNPVNEKFTINYNGLNGHELKAEIYNNLGMKVISKMLSGKETTCTIEGLSSGVYTCVITQNGAIIKNEKIIITY